MIVAKGEAYNSLLTYSPVVKQTAAWCGTLRLKLLEATMDEHELMLEAIAEVNWELKKDEDARVVALEGLLRRGRQMTVEQVLLEAKEILRNGQEV